MRKSHVSMGLQQMFSAEVIGGFILGSLALSVLGNAIYGLLTNWLGAGSLALAGIALGMALILSFSAWTLTHILRRGSNSAIVGKRPPRARSGIIVLVSNNLDALRKAIAWHGDDLKNCWLICSPLSAPNARILEEELNLQGKAACLELVNDVYDPIKFLDKVTEINTRATAANIKTEDIILDFTGMTSIASVGCVLACLQARLPLQYTPGVSNPNMKAVVPLDPMEITLEYSIQPLPARAVVTDTPSPHLTAHP